MGDVVNFENKSDSYKQLFDDYIGNDDYLMYTCINVLSEMNCPLTKEGISQFQEDTGELDVTGVITVNELFYLIDELNMDNRQAVFDHIDRMEYTSYLNGIIQKLDTYGIDKKKSSNKPINYILFFVIILLAIYGTGTLFINFMNFIIK